MGNSSSSPPSRKKLSSPQQAQVALYDRVLSQMVSNDEKTRTASRPGKLALFTHWLWMVLALVETPIHLVHHGCCYVMTVLLVLICRSIIMLYDGIAASLLFIKQKGAACGKACRGGGEEHDAMNVDVIVPDAMVVDTVDSAKGSLKQQQIEETDTRDAAPDKPRCSLLLYSLYSIFVCLGRSWAHHYFMLLTYLENVGTITFNIFHPHRPTYFYSDSFIPLKRPPVPVFVHIAATGAGAGSLCDACCNCTFDCTSCFTFFSHLCTRLVDALTPIGAARRSPARFTRSLYFTFTCCGSMHCSRTLGPMCDCCRRCYDDYDKRGLQWLEEFEERQDVATRAWFREVYALEGGEGGYEGVLAVAIDEAERKRLEEQEAQEAPLAAPMVRDVESQGEVAVVEEEEKKGLFRRAAGFSIGVTVGAVTLPFTISASVVRTTAGLIWRASAEESEGQGEDTGEARGREYDADEDDLTGSEAMSDLTGSERAGRLLKRGAEDYMSKRNIT